jgi:hypothetical protein
MEKITFDKRLRITREIYAKAYPQMIQYFAARYSWGQPCDPARANDWAMLCAHLAGCQWQGQDPAWDKQWAWPSGNHGSMAGMINCYHDGWALLEDLGLYESEDCFA